MQLTWNKALAVSLCLPLSAFALNSGHGLIAVQWGGFISSAGKDQNINIQSLAGNHYTVNRDTRGNGLIGLGYYLKSDLESSYQLFYGINGFYLPNTSVKGLIIQEQSFTNLAYHYEIEHLPIYFAAKAVMGMQNNKYSWTIDAGVGPNFMHTHDYYETPLIKNIIPDNAFTGRNDVAFTATAGIGLQFNNVLGATPFECGYRFFYLGQGRLNNNNNQVLNALQTGDTYANALLCSVTI